MPKATPEYWHVLEEDTYRDKVYEPEADSFLLLDALDTVFQSDAAAPAAPGAALLLELGCGSGVALTHAATLLHRPAEGRPVACVAVDLNPVALLATAETFRRTFAKIAPSQPEGWAPPSLELIRGDLVSFMRQCRHVRGAYQAPSAGLSAGAAPHRLAGLHAFDLVIFNPPYVPTGEAELAKACDPARNDGDWMYAAWSGGPQGRLVVDRLLPALPDLLAPAGQALIVALEENDIPAMVASASAPADALEGDVVASRWTGEKLRILRLRRGPPDA